MVIITANTVKDCWDKKCPHFHLFDVKSIDDLYSVCGLLRKQHDECDKDFSSFVCPLDDNGHINEKIK